MKTINKKYVPKERIIWIAMFVVAILMSYIPLPFYITHPGEAQALDEMVSIKERHQDSGDFMLTTVRVGRATPVQYIWAKFSDYRMIYRATDIRQQDETDEEYEQRQRQMMKGSQSAAIIVAFQKAGKKLKVKDEGVFVTGIISEMPAAQQLQVGDLIVAVDGKALETREALLALLKNKQKGESVQFTIIRDQTKLTRTLTVEYFPPSYQTVSKDKVGIGITDPVTNKTIVTEPPVTFHTEEIGGPSAGLMFTLEIYNQLTETDWTKGYEIAGTGTMSADGKVGAIGGIKQKIVAADNAEVEIFFAPVKGNNYKDAIEAAEDIETDMKVVPVETFDNALYYLKNLTPKKGT